MAWSICIRRNVYQCSECHRFVYQFIVRIWKDDATCCVNNSFFSVRWEAYKMRSCLAAIDHNRHSQRPQKKTADGKLCYRRKWLRRSKRWTAVPELVPKTHSYIPKLLSAMVTHYADQHISVRQGSVRGVDDPRHLAATIACVPPQPVSLLVEQHRSRLQWVPILWQSTIHESSATTVLSAARQVQALFIAVLLFCAITVCNLPVVWCGWWAASSSANGTQCS